MTDEAAPSEPPEPARLAMVACLHLMASKGWLPERKLQALHDFLAAKSLYAEFNKFIERLK